MQHAKHISTCFAVAHGERLAGKLTVPVSENHTHLRPGFHDRVRGFASRVHDVPLGSFLRERDIGRPFDFFSITQSFANRGFTPCAKASLIERDDDHGLLAEASHASFGVSSSINFPKRVKFRFF